MHLLYQIFVDPFVQMGAAPDLFAQTLWDGLVAGVLYALIALGFVLIFKASGVFNFAQGIMVVFAALTLVGLHEHGVPAFLALGLTIVVMFVLAFSVERLMLRPLVNQSDVILFMATFGLTYILIGLGQLIFGGNPKVMITNELYLPSGELRFKGLGGFVSFQKIDIAAGIIASLMVAVLAVFFQRTRIGRALRAVADSHQAALSVGISLEQIWVIVWFAAGVVALTTGIMWGARSEVSFALQIIALKALPVLILGGLTYILIGLGQLIFGGNPKVMIANELYLPSGEMRFKGLGGFVSFQKIDIAAVIIASLMVAVLAVFFQRTRIGRALRAVADSHQAALSVGISLEQIWVIVWFAAGVVALTTGIMWGARSEVSFSLQIIALKALPVLILGGLTSIPGAIVGGLIIGIGEKLGEFYWGPLLGGGIETWFAYVIALGFLVFRPQGLFGEKIIERI